MTTITPKKRVGSFDLWKDDPAQVRTTRNTRVAPNQIHAKVLLVLGEWPIRW